MTKMAKYRRATEVETDAYRFTVTVDGGEPLYPLCGFVTVDGCECPVEFLGRSWDKGDPQYEVVAPKGYHFKRESLHSKLGLSLHDIRERVHGERLERCSADDANAECSTSGSPDDVA